MNIVSFNDFNEVNDAIFNTVSGIRRKFEKEQQQHYSQQQELEQVSPTLLPCKCGHLCRDWPSWKVSSCTPVDIFLVVVVARVRPRRRQSISCAWNFVHWRLCSSFLAFFLSLPIHFRNPKFIKVHFHKVSSSSYTGGGSSGRLFQADIVVLMSGVFVNQL